MPDRGPGLTHLVSFLLYLALALPYPALATTLFDKEFTCALCAKTFTDRVAGSTNVRERDSELRPYTTGLEPTPYFIHSCPYCGFTDDGHRLVLSDREKTELKEFLAAYCQQHPCARLSPAEKYEVYARSLEIRGKLALAIAFQYQRAAWMADDAGNAAAARTFRQKTIQFLAQALQSNQVPAKEVALYTYLVGELHRRLGNFPAARDWFNQVANPNPRLARLLEQQKGLALKGDAGPAKMPAF